MAVIFKVHKNENKEIVLTDNSGREFIPAELNDRSTWTYKRACAAANNPQKWAYKASINGSGEFKLTRTSQVGGFIDSMSVSEAGFESELGGIKGLSSIEVPIEPPKSIQPEPPKSAVMPENILSFIHSEAAGLKPKMLFMNPLKWKFLIRNILRGKNIMMTGPAGCGKTMAAKSAANAIEGYGVQIFNLGSTQDPRATLIGNTQFDNSVGTVFNPSPFVKAIQTPNTVIVLDELSRAHPEAHNILMTVLDQGQRYLRLDEAADSPIVKVAEGVSFIASANIGNEYTSTRQLDRAIVDRFTIIEMDTLTKDEEFQLLQMMYGGVEASQLEAVAEITSMTRMDVKSESPNLTNSISTRTAVEIGSLLEDGFSLAEAAEITIYPLFDDAGGGESERVFIKQFVQKFIPTETESDIFNVENVDNPFN